MLSGKAKRQLARSGAPIDSAPVPAYNLSRCKAFHKCARFWARPLCKPGGFDLRGGLPEMTGYSKAAAADCSLDPLTAASASAAYSPCGLFPDDPARALTFVTYGKLNHAGQDGIAFKLLLRPRAKRGNRETCGSIVPAHISQRSIISLKMAVFAIAAAPVRELFLWLVRRRLYRSARVSGCIDHLVESLKGARS
jgi:hypothetical protein